MKRIMLKRGIHAALNLDSGNLRLVLGVLFVFLLILSLTLYFLSNPWNARVLFFPEGATGKLVGERRFLPPRRGLTAEVELYVQELILGPADPLLSRIVSREVRLHSVIVQDGKAYVSLSREILEPVPDAALSFDQTLQTIANGVLYNFPRVRGLYLLVDGQLPGEQYADGFTIEKKLFK
ncbi:MAG: GerMN domain-containing protein [Spirochaetaceae bacterium]|nr:MAG: GerMN domain-containing protein [Spirochaetaceae bacterium]